MKHFLISAVVSAVLLTACGDDISSNANNEDAAKVFSITKSLHVDESQHILTMSLENWETMMCVVEGDNFTWKKVNINFRPDSFAYAFDGDELVLYGVYNGEPGDSKSLVGGIPGNLYGKWSKKNRYANQTMNFSKEKVEISYQYNHDLYWNEHSDFMNSYFMSEIIRTLGGSYPEILPYTIWSIDTADVLANAENNGAVFTSKTKTSATIEMLGKTYTVNVKDVDLYIQEDGPFIAKENRYLQAEVSNGDTVCTVVDILQYMNADYCKAEYKDHLNLGEWEYSNHEKFTAAVAYKIDTGYDFEHCVASIAAKSYYDLHLPR